MAGVLVTYSVVITERQGDWIEKHMDKTITFYNSRVDCPAHETVSSWMPEISIHCTAFVICDYLSQWFTKQSELWPAYLEKYFNRYDSLMGSSGLPATCWPLYILLGNSQGKEIIQFSGIFVDFTFSMFVMFYFVSSLGVRNPYIEFNMLKIYILCFNQSQKIPYSHY